MAQEILQGKVKLKADLILETGLHIGGSSDFAPIGAVDSTIVRDPYTKQPIIPGSSLKGKLRSLLRRNEGGIDFAKDVVKESPVLKRLFGIAGKEIIPARLQFFDLKMTNKSVKELMQLDMDTYLGEIKFENQINPLTGEANPRQIERVPAGAVFAFQLVYNVVSLEDIAEDMQKLWDGLQLLKWDYLGGSGSRGYGRITFGSWQTPEIFATDKAIKAKITSLLAQSLKDV